MINIIFYWCVNLLNEWAKFFGISYELINIIIFIIGYPLFVLLLLRILSVSIVAYFLWPRIIPQVFTNVNADPGFLNLLGLSLIIGLLL